VPPVDAGTDVNFPRFEGAIQGQIVKPCRAASKDVNKTTTEQGAYRPCQWL